MMFKNIFYIKCLFTLLILFGSVNHMMASHIAGGELSYRCLGNDQYEVTLTVRRDCENADDDANFDDPANIGVYDIFGNLQAFMGDRGAFQLEFMGSTVITEEFDFDCSILGSLICVEESIYRDTIELPFNKLGYILAYQRCCRNTILTNIEDPLETGATYFVEIPINVLEMCNSQPVFNTWPDVYVCVNESYSFDHSAVDADGDVLVYRLCTPRSGASIEFPAPNVPSNPPYDPVVFASPFDISNLLGGNALQINSSTGQITATPNQEGTFLVGVCVEEYRNGEKISEVRRDFELNVRACGDAVDIDFDVIGNDCDGDLTVLFDNNTTLANSFLWTITDSQGNIVIQSNDEDFNFDFPAFGAYEVVLEATRASDGCVARKRENIVIGTDDLNIDFDAQFESCIDGNLIRLIDLSSDPTGATSPINWDWTVNGVSAPNSNPSLIDIGNQQVLEIELLVTFDSGCTGTISKTIDVSDLFPTVDISAGIISCLEDGYNVQFDVNTNFASPIVDVEWTIGSQTFDTQVIETEIPLNGTDVSLEVTFENGCTASVSRFINGEDLLPRLNIVTDVDGVDCPPAGVANDVTFSPSITGSFISGNIVEYNWVLNGIEYNTENVTLSLMQGDIVDASLEVIYDNGCTIENMIQYVANFAPPIDISVEVDCSTSPATLILTENSNTSGNVTYEWLVDQVVMSQNNSLTLNLDDNGNQVDLIVSSPNGCSSTYSQFFDADDYANDAEIIFSNAECNADGTISVTIDSNDFGQEVISELWIINGTTYTSTPIQLIVDPGTQIDITATLSYDNGCTVVETLNQNIDDILGIGDPILDYSIEPIECFGDSGIFVFTDLSSIPLCLQIVSQVWVINGVVCTGSPVTKTLPLGVDIDFSLTVTYSNGVVISTVDDGNPDNDIINTNDIVDQIDVEIGSNLIGNCDDSLSLFIIDPNPNVDYEWSTDSDFTNILGTGVTLDTLGGDLFNGTVYVQTINNIGDCVYGTGSITLESDAIDLSFDMPFIICPGDTANFEVINNNPNQTITYEWKGGNGELIGDGDTNAPLIGVGDDVTDDFFLVLCTENELGCTSIDTINFEIGTREDLEPFTYEPEDCGSLTINFDESPNMIGEDAFWDFGDGNTGNGSTVSNTYDMAGIYTVTLSDSSDVCAGNPIMMDIVVGDLPIEIIGGANDTIFYDVGSLVDLTAETVVTNGEISWCLEDGTNIGTGNPLEDFDPMGDTLVVIAKITDEFGCIGSDTIVLVPNNDPQSCLDSVVITGPDPAVVCESEEFQLCVIMDEECDMMEYSYLWDPEDCIVSGQGSPKVTISTDGSKTISVLITHIESGLDSIYTFDVEVSIPMVDISVPEINIDENGNPFVCLGEDVDLSVSPEDPNCTYTWNTGDTGPVINVSPEMTTTYTVQCVDEFGCESVEETITIEVVPPQCDESDVFIPNAFSPNGDSNNDVLFVRSKFIDEMELIVTNRWGEEVFKSTDQSEGWDGTHEGKTLAPDVFAYCIKVTCIDGQEYIKAGNVSIIK